MKTSFSPADPDYPVMSAMVQDQFGSLPSLEIEANDEMYAFSENTCGTRTLGLMAYFRAGIQINDAVRQIVKWHFGAPENLKTFLDFASGYGRSTRFLVSDLGPERVWASDVLPGALEFQRSQLGVQTVFSTTKPESFRPGQLWDCIFVSSLFSHLPEVTFTRWLWKLHSLLKPGGILIFSVHGEVTMPPGATMPRSGLYFIPTTEIPSLDTGDYGAAIVTDGYVRNAIVAVTGVPEHVRIPQGLCFTQDLYVIAKGKLKDQPLQFQFGPNGCVDFCRWTEPEEMKLTGWAVEATAGESIARVDVYYNGTLRGTCGINHFRPDVAAFLGMSQDPGALRSGWDCVVDLRGEKVRPEQDWMLVKAISSNGREFVLRLDHPSQIAEFESLCGWTYSESAGSSQAITAVVRFIDYPRNGRFISSDTNISGWIATKDPSVLEGITLEGRFGPIPFTPVQRPDVAEAHASTALGFEATLPPEYLTAPDPRLRFTTRSGVVLATLDTVVDTSALTLAAASRSNH